MITPEQIGAPRIAAPLAAENRPFWSVMIPVYNRVTTLPQALRSVLTQFAPTDILQIEVLDDASDSPAAIRSAIEQVADSRVTYHANANRLGMVGNWNECLNRARGQWVHILHDDDYVMPGFYSSLRKQIESQPHIGFAFTDAITVDNAGAQLSTYAPFKDHRGLMPDWTGWIAITNPLLAPSVVIRRSAAEAVGGFHPALTHATDWEMWMRLAAHFATWHEPQILACYRQHDSSETDRQTQTGENVADISRALEIARHYFPADRADEMLARSRHYWAMGAVRGAEAQFARGEIVAGLNQFREATKLSVSMTMVRLLGQGALTRFDQYVQSLIPILERHLNRPQDEQAAHQASQIRRQVVLQWLRVPATELQIHLESELGNWHRLLQQARLNTDPPTAEDNALMASAPTAAHASIIKTLFPN